MHCLQFSVVRYESVIHEFDPYFNYRSTIKLVTEGAAVAVASRPMQHAANHMPTPQHDSTPRDESVRQGLVPMPTDVPPRAALWMP